jgi:hypothetical protein
MADQQPNFKRLTRERSADVDLSVDATPKPNAVSFTTVRRRESPEIDLTIPRDTEALLLTIEIGEYADLQALQSWASGILELADRLIRDNGWPAINCTVEAYTGSIVFKLSLGEGGNPATLTALADVLEPSLVAYPLGTQAAAHMGKIRRTLLGRN